MIVSFIHTLFLYPEVAQRVYEEIQIVTHGQRLPTVSDRSSLPYTEAFFKESIRKRPFVPVGEPATIFFSFVYLTLVVGVPHVNSEDEVFRGYLIPKGTMIHQCNG